MLVCSVLVLFLQCALCGSRAGVWNFDKHVERPCQLDYLTLKCQSGQEAEAKGDISGESLPTHSLKGTAGATGYTCLTSPLYVASPTVVNLHKTIAGGDTIASFGLQPDLPAPSPSEKDLAKAKEGESARELKVRHPFLLSSFLVSLSLSFALRSEKTRKVSEEATK